jgi:hypothetical protein
MMIDPMLSIGILVAALAVGAVCHALVAYAGRASLLGWIILEIALWAWFLIFDPGVIFKYTLIATAIPAVLLMLLLGLPFEQVRRKRIRRIGAAVRREGGFACPHCGLVYDREREDDRCPDCGGAVDGAPGMLG